MDITALLKASLQDIFMTMIPLELTEGTQSVDLSAAAVFHVSGMIGVSGHYQGMLALHCSNEVAEAITIAFLMLEEGEQVESSDLKDAIGELVNMVAGGLKGGFATHDIDISIAVPTTIAGRAYTINCLSNASWVNIPFRLESGDLTLEFKYRETA